MAETNVMARRRVLRVFDPRVQCPAGEPISETVAGSGCHCRIEDSEILSALDPSSLGFCLGDYKACPTWVAARNREIAERLSRRDVESSPERADRGAGWRREAV